MAIRIEPLTRKDIVAAHRVLGEACPYDRAAEVAEEKLLLPAPAGTATAFGAWDVDDETGYTQLAGVAAVSARWLRVLAVAPRARRRGIGSALLDACEATARAYLDAQPAPADGSAPRRRFSVLDQPGNYLAPGIDERNTETIAWLEKRGYTRGETRTNVLVDVRGNSRVTPERLVAAIDAARTRGYEVRRARLDEREALCAAVASEFGGAWPFEVARALAFGDDELERGARSAASGGAADDIFVKPAQVAPSGTMSSGGASDGIFVEPARVAPSDAAASDLDDVDVYVRPRREPAVHVAIKDGAYCAFAAHDGNNQGIGWFGPTGTWPAHRGQGLGEALLLACLLDVAETLVQCEVAWIGPRPFYDKVAGVASDRYFVPMTKTL